MSVIPFPKSRCVDGHGIVVFSHLRWNFVFQRPQHLLSRFAKEHNVLFIEEPVQHEGLPEFVVTESKESVRVAVPYLPDGTKPDAEKELLENLVTKLLEEQQFKNYISWYYTPMMLTWSRHLDPLATVYDCMDELSAFKNAPPELQSREAELFEQSDLVFTGGRSLFETKREQHRSVHCFPSSIDVAHFKRALGADSRSARSSSDRTSANWILWRDRRKDGCRALAADCRASA